MKKKLLTLLAVMLLVSGCALAKPKQNTLDVLPLFSSQSNQANRLWVGTFQLAWNDLMDGIVKGPVLFTGKTPSVVKQLNNQDFKADQLSENSYYKTYGETSPELKKAIEEGIKEKFGETSDVLDGADWTRANGKYTVYAMLKKDFKFLKAFDKLKSEKFGKSAKKVQYFGIDKKSNHELYDNVTVLFYNSSKDFAVGLLTQSDDIVYLYRTDDNKSFDKLYADMQKKQSAYKDVADFGEKDELKVPNINLYKLKSFDEVCERQIKGTNIKIDKAVETVDFKMNNEGVKLKSEALIMTKMTALAPEASHPRKLYFNDTFVMFLQERDKQQPYFALRVDDVAAINKLQK